ncbi:MAG: hypothetical protein EAX96_17350 [Candidatus Lokiarchaeota archaeon]|nr:hypothetical protein [Candidatus Lokiarchaeota archaeon]
MLKIRKIFNPSMFQGNLKNKNYFEGWYYKIVDSSEKNLYAFIPGISLDKTNNTSHCFIQMLNGATGETVYFEYPLDKFWASSQEFKVKIGENIFTTDKINLSIHQKGFSIVGKLNFKNTVPWQKTLLAPGIMGPFTFIPFMECYHGMLSMNHDIVGKLTINDKEIDFTNGLGYMEKDWGKSFPNGYIWMQSNHFKKGKTSFMASIARIPFLGFEFPGFLFIIWHQGKIYLLTTYTGAKIQALNIKPKRVKAVITNKNYILFFNARKKHKKELKVSEETAGSLKSPSLGAMKSRIMESLTSEVQLKLYKRDKQGKKKLIFEDIGHNTGLEIEATDEDLS